MLIQIWSVASTAAKNLVIVEKQTKKQALQVLVKELAIPQQNVKMGVVNSQVNAITNLLHAKTTLFRSSWPKWLLQRLRYEQWKITRVKGQLHRKRAKADQTSHISIKVTVRGIMSVKNSARSTWVQGRSHQSRTSHQSRKHHTSQGQITSITGRSHQSRTHQLRKRVTPVKGRSHQ